MTELQTFRRKSHSPTVQQLWDAVQSAVSQRQQPNFERVSKYMSRVHNVPEDVTRQQLDYCQRDGLIEHFNVVGIKGKVQGQEQERYKIPTELENDEHDWYCFECHESGEVICCHTCHRVYHLDCLPDCKPPVDKSTFTCPVCQNIALEQASSLKSDRNELNQLLVYTCARLAPRLPNDVLERKAHGPPTAPPSERSTPGRAGSSAPITPLFLQEEKQEFRTTFLCYQPLLSLDMERKALGRKYKSLAEFQADAATVLHNVAIFHGANSMHAQNAKLLLSDCIYDLNEIRQCRDCYRRSNETDRKYWFCLPCRPPHKLVFAKQKGFPYWPAKVIKEVDGMFDVRFFGYPYERSKLDKQYIRPITTSLQSMGLGSKRTAMWKRAYDELRRHQQLLNKPTVSLKPTSPSKEEEQGHESEEQSDSEVEMPPKKKAKKTHRGRGRKKSTVAQSKSADEEEMEVEKTPPRAVSADTKGPGKGKRKRTLVYLDKKNSHSAKLDSSSPGGGGGLGESAAEQTASSHELGEKPELSREQHTPPPPPDEAPSVEEQPPASDTEQSEPPPSQLEQQESQHEEEEAAVAEEEQQQVAAEREEQEEEEGRDNEDSDLSSGEDGSLLPSTRQSHPPAKEAGEEELVSSSCNEPHSCSIGVQTPPRFIKNDVSGGKRQSQDHGASSSGMASASEMKVALVSQIKKHALEMERMQKQHKNELAQLQEKHQQILAESKRKQWCYNCELEAIYHCCWNTAYCSTECQQAHWHKEHKKQCRRKR